jgi:hypothetical protein
VSGKTAHKAWQLRLAADEDALATKLAGDRSVSKNDVIRSALRLLARIEKITSSGGRLYVERRGDREPFEVWLL